LCELFLIEAIAHYGFEAGLQFVDAACEARLEVEEIREDFRFDETAEGEGEDLRFRFDAFDERLERGVGLEAMDFEGHQLGFVDGDSAEAPLEVREFGDGGGVERVGGAVVIEVFGVMLLVVERVLIGEEGVAGGESMREGVAGGGEFAGFGAWAGGEEGVGAVGVEL
jgi:hypothetical protein